jgi:probable phosphoglycerate mutase
MPDSHQEVLLIRHGETEWSRSGQHTSHTDLALTENGRRMAMLLGAALHDRHFALVLVSPLRRARDTCRLAGFGDQAQIRPDLMEWEYGDYEGLTTPQIREQRPGWSLWTDGCPGGETAEQVGARVDLVIAEARGARGDVALFAHGHVLRVLTARWLDLPPEQGRLFALGTGTISALGYERQQPVILRWNQAVNP